MRDIRTFLADLHFPGKDEGQSTLANHKEPVNTCWGNNERTLLNLGHNTRLRRPVTERVNQNGSREPYATRPRAGQGDWAGGGDVRRRRGGQVKVNVYGFSKPVKTVRSDNANERVLHLYGLGPHTTRSQKRMLAAVGELKHTRTHYIKYNSPPKV